MSKTPNLFEADVIKKFIENLDTALQNNARGDGMGADNQLYDALWFQMTNMDVATVYLTVLMGKLMKMESNSLKQQDNNSAPTDESSKIDENSPDANQLLENEIKLQQIVKELNLGTQKQDPQHPLLIKRRESNTKRSSMVVQADEKVSEYVLGSGILNRVETTPINSPVQEDNENDDDSNYQAPNAGSSINYAIPQTNQKFYSYNTSVQNERKLFTKNQIIERAAIMNSLIYVSLFYRFDHTNPSLLFLLHDWKNLRAQQLVSNNVQHDSLTEEIREALCPPASADALYKYIHQCADYDVVRENDTVLRPPLSNYDPLAMVGSYVYCRLQTVFRTPKYTDLVLQLLTKLIRSASTTQSNLPENYDTIALKNALNLVKMILPQLFIANNQTTARILQELMTVVQNFFLEPCPIGSTCHEILAMCYQEQNNRGSLTRKRFESSVRVVRGENGQPTEKRRRVNILFNGQAEFAHHLIDRFNVNNGELNPDEVFNIKANLTLNVFEQSSDKEIQGLCTELEQKVPVPVLCNNYKGAVEALNDPQSLKELHAKMLNEASSVKGPMVVRKQSPAMPEVEFNLIELPEESDLAQSEKRERKVFPRSVIYDELILLIDNARKEGIPNSEGVINLDVAVAGGSGTVQHFVHSVYIAHKNELLAPKEGARVELQVYLIPLGENNYLSCWLEKYDGWYSRHLHHPMLARIGMIPQVKPTRRHVQQTSGNTTDRTEDTETGGRTKRGTIMNPTLSSTLSKKSMLISAPVKTLSKRTSVSVNNYKAPQKYLTPHRFMRTLLSDYVIDANETVPVHIYNLQCLCQELQGPPNAQTKSGKVKSFLSLSFCQRLDIGIYAEALQFQRDNNLTNVTLEELLQHKQFKYQGLELKVSYVPMDPTGELNRSSEINEQTKTFQNIAIKSTSRFGDRGSLVGPNQPWLEVFADENLKSDNRRKKKLRDCDLGTQYHVGSITIESPTAAYFSVLMDGELYGPFHKIIINASDYRFPLRTFNKVDVY